MEWRLCFDRFTPTFETVDEAERAEHFQPREPRALDRPQRRCSGRHHILEDNDLRARGLDRDVLVVVLGEFGRTPKITQLGPGREHWAEAGCAVFFGGGLQMGQVIGETDGRAERAKTGTISFQNIVATIYHVLGIDRTAQLTDFNGRPQFLLSDPEPIRELVG